jgi:hypothetical protein
VIVTALGESVSFRERLGLGDSLFWREWEDVSKIT